MKKSYDESVLSRWSEPPIIDDSKFTKYNNTAEIGEGFAATDEEKASVSELMKKHNYNLFASEHISLHRKLPDLRYDACKNLIYPEKLPTTSIIIIFHNEAWSTLLRTVWGIIERTPRELIEEIILVDDNSDWPILKRPLDDYIELLPIKIKIIRTTKRNGLIRARLIGAEIAKVCYGSIYFSLSENHGKH